MGSLNLVGRARFELAVSWSQTRRFAELSYRPPFRDSRPSPQPSPLAGGGGNSNRQALERAGGEHRPDRPRPMAVPSLLLRAHLPKRPPRLRNQEDRVVAETSDTPPLMDDLPAALALEEFRRPAGRGPS